MKPAQRNNRLAIIGSVAVLLSGAAALILIALNNSVSFFMTPSELAARAEAPDWTFRLGGVVQEGSVRRGDGITTWFQITDGAGTVDVVYSDVLPDLFKEGQGVIAEGVLTADGHFEARSVLAKHDENYVPKELQGVQADLGPAS